MPRALLLAAGVVTVFALIAGPVALAVHESNQMRNFRVVREGVLYRSGQMTIAGLRRAVHDHGIRTVITLRDEAAGRNGDADRAETEFCSQQEIYHFRLLPRSWDLNDGIAPVDENVQQFLEILDDPRHHPVLVHCFAGVHRTGAYCAIYRMEFEQWSRERAKAEMKSCGYDNLENELDILGYLEQYQPRRERPARP